MRPIGITEYHGAGVIDIQGCQQPRPCHVRADGYII